MLTQAQTAVEGKLDTTSLVTPITNSNYAIDTVNTSSITLGNVHFLYLSISCVTPAGSWVNIGTLDPSCVANSYPMAILGDINIQINGTMLRAHSGTANSLRRGMVVYMS